MTINLSKFKNTVVKKFTLGSEKLKKWKRVIVEMLTASTKKECCESSGMS